MLGGLPIATVERVLLALWVGSMWTVGYLVAPLLFAHLPSPAAAGAMAGEIFTATAYLGIGCGLVLLGAQWRRTGPGRRWRVWLIAAMLVLLALGEFGVRSAMVQAQGTPEFGRLHGIAQGIFLLVSLMGLVLVGAGVRPSAPAR